ncbi:MAG: hypothetical protein Fur0041_15190 [Bacteroidia bacterium]
MHLLICSPDAYSLFNTNTRYPFGGAEVRAVHFARGLSETGRFKISVITRNQGRGKETFGKIEVYPHPELHGKGYWEKRNTLTERIKFKLGLHRPTPFSNSDELLNIISPDAVLILGMSPEAVECFRLAQKRKIKFIFGAASDIDLTYDESTHQLAEQYREVIQHADLVLAQTPFQQKTFSEKFGVKSELLLNPVSANKPSGKTVSPCDVLWIGKSSAIKQPELFIRLAAELPRFSFRMILNKADDTIYRTCFNQKPENLEIIEQVPFEEIQDYYCASKIFVSTSSFEGFPNTFLQAAVYGLPIVSLHADPNQMLSVHGCGVVTSGDVSLMSQQIIQLMNSQQMRHEIQTHEQRYIQHFHDSEAIVGKLHDLIIAIFKE